MEPDLIDRYVADLRHQLRWRRDADDLAAEAADHLRTGAQALHAGGEDPERAQELALASFGSVEQVAQAHLRGPDGRLAVATESTKRTGRLLRWMALSWIAVAVFGVGLMDGGGVFSWASDAPYVLFVGVLQLGLGTLVVLGFALVDRHAGLGRAGSIAVAALVFCVLLSIVAWALPFWMTILGLTTTLLTVLLVRRNVVARGPVVLLALAAPAGLLTFVVLRAAEVGPVDEWGDHPVAGGVSVIVVSVLLAAAVRLIGTQLASEDVHVTAE